MRTSRLHRCFILVFALALTATMAAPVQAASNFVKVELTYTEGAEPCITVDPPSAKIFWNQKPRRVRWISKNDKGLFWEIAWKGEEASGGKPNFFGKKFDIPGEATQKDSDRPQRRGWMAPGASWPYMIRVYSTAPGIARGALLCELDPVIDWGD